MYSDVLRHAAVQPFVVVSLAPDRPEVVRSARSPPLELAGQCHQLLPADRLSPCPFEGASTRRRLEALRPTQPRATPWAVAIDVAETVGAEHAPGELCLRATGSAPDARTERDTSITG
jgi:hypothetical protein